MEEGLNWDGEKGDTEGDEGEREIKNTKDV